MLKIAPVCTSGWQWTVRKKKKKKMSLRSVHCGSAEVKIQRAQIMTLNTSLTSLKRFQCLIFRLYWEMVDSHCSSSMKFPAFVASFPLFTSTWSETPTSRHRQTTDPTTTMLVKQFGLGCILFLLLLLLLSSSQWSCCCCCLNTLNGN